LSSAQSDFETKAVKPPALETTALETTALEALETTSSEIANDRGLTGYSCCLSANTAIGTIDAFTEIPGLTTEDTRLPLPGGGILRAAAPSHIPWIPVWTAIISVEIRCPGPGMVVICLNF